MASFFIWLMVMANKFVKGVLTKLKICLQNLLYQFLCFPCGLLYLLFEHLLYHLNQLLNILHIV